MSCAKSYVNDTARRRKRVRFLGLVHLHTAQDLVEHAHRFAQPEYFFLQALHFVQRCSLTFHSDQYGLSHG